MQTERHCDILITGGTVFDGSGAPGVAADLAIDGKTITAIYMADLKIGKQTR